MNDECWSVSGASEHPAHTGRSTTIARTPLARHHRDSAVPDRQRFLLPITGVDRGAGADRRQPAVHATHEREGVVQRHAGPRVGFL